MRGETRECREGVEYSLSVWEWMSMKKSIESGGKLDGGLDVVKYRTPWLAGVD